MLRVRLISGMHDHFLSLVRGRRGHFLYESGHHGDLWFDLETLCAQPSRLRPLVAELAARLAPYKPDAVCGPLVEGAFIALLVAEQLGCTFTYAARFAPESSNALFPVEYRVPGSLHASLAGKRVAIVNDVINAGSAVRGAYQDLRGRGAQVIAVGTLLTLGDAFSTFAAEHGLAVESLMMFPNQLWAPAECPLCATGMTLERLAIS
jgi:orotate phosphoribosyltransferase